MSILENELVRKYFAYDEHPSDRPRMRMAERVLAAMEAEIKNGDKLLELGPDGDVAEVLADKRWDAPRVTSFHGFFLRLPDRFQANVEFPNSTELPEDFKLWGLSVPELRLMRDYASSHGWKPAESYHDAVEAMIKESIMEAHPNCMGEDLKMCSLLPKLRALVRLARGGK